MPEECEKSEIVPISKQKGDPLECGNFRGIKLLEHGMKMFEKILERRLITVNNIQFGFSSGKGTTDAVFIIQQLQEKTPRSAQGSVLYQRKFGKGVRVPGIWSIGVIEGDGSNIPWGINSSENNAWQN